MAEGAGVGPTDNVYVETDAGLGEEAGIKRGIRDFVQLYRCDLFFLD